MPRDSRLTELLANLMPATTSGLLHWGTDDGKTFAAEVGKDLVVLIEKDFSAEDSEEEYWINLKNTKIDKIIKNYYVVESDPDLERAANLYEAARENAYQVDQTIDQIISDIRKGMMKGRAG